MQDFNINERELLSMLCNITLLQCIVFPFMSLTIGIDSHLTNLGSEQSNP